MMKNLYILSMLLMAAVSFTSCDDNLADEQEQPNAPYVLSLGITSNGNTTYYVVSTSDLMSGTINAVGKGIEQQGYHDY